MTHKPKLEYQGVCLNCNTSVTMKLVTKRISGKPCVHDWKRVEASGWEYCTKCNKARR